MFEILKGNQVQASYDLVADQYVDRIYNELKDKPLDRELLNRFVNSIPAEGIVADLGCGPGHVSRFLKDAGASVVGVDLSPKMVETARTLNPDIQFHRGDMLYLRPWHGAWSGIVAFYSIVNFTPEQLPTAFRQMHTCLKPGGKLLLSFHIGEGGLHLDNWWDQPVSVDFFFFKTDEIVRHLLEAGFHVEETIERDPYPDVEHPSRRSYIFCHRMG